MKTNNIKNFEGDLASIQELAKLAHDIKLVSDEQGRIFQIWSDGEITVLLRGKRLGVRSSHRIVGGIGGINIEMPCANVHDERTFAFVTSADAYEIGRQIVNFIKRYQQIDVSTDEVDRYDFWMRSHQKRAA